MQVSRSDLSPSRHCCVALMVGTPVIYLRVMALTDDSRAQLLQRDHYFGVKLALSVCVCAQV